MSANTEFDEFCKRMQAAASRCQSKAVLRSAYTTVNKAAKAIARAVAIEIGFTSFPTVRPRWWHKASPMGYPAVKDAVRAQVLKGISGGRVYVDNHEPRSMQMTWRSRQPLLPIAFWYEGGFDAPRVTRKGGVSRGPAGPVRGIDALTHHYDDFTRYEDELYKAYQAYIDDVTSGV